MLKRLLFSTVIVGALAAPAFAATNFDIDIGIAPPAPRYEVVPAARPGYVWAPGFWAWEGGRHTWREGHWMEGRPGYAWVGDRWEQHGNHWGHAPGHWQADPHWDHNQDWRHDEHHDWDHDHDQDHNWNH